MGRARPTWIDVTVPGPVKPGLARQAVLVLCAAIFAADLLEPSVTALATLYAIPVLISTWVGTQRATTRTAGLCLVLVLATPFLSAWWGMQGQAPLWMVLVNRAAAVFTIAMVTSLGLLRLQVEERLASTREAALTTLRSIADAVITVNIEGRVTYFNPVAEGLTGVSAEEAAGARLEDVFHVVERGPTRPPIEELARRGAQVDEGTLVARDGRRRRIEERRSPL
ncbi:MAG TPA: PAS domain-containing protein, partial [Planctomycetota bacterium]|nr:PAS domain-containing protein [Planctomycetota bacterium]